MRCKDTLLISNFECSILNLRSALHTFEIEHSKIRNSFPLPDTVEYPEALYQFAAAIKSKTVIDTEYKALYT
jgi:hypothetical protein